MFILNFNYLDKFIVVILLLFRRNKHFVKKNLKTSGDKQPEQSSILEWYQGVYRIFERGTLIISYNLQC